VHDDAQSAAPAYPATDPGAVFMDGRKTKDSPAS
jgi:hypothetical protein